MRFPWSKPKPGLRALVAKWDMQTVHDFLVERAVAEGGGVPAFLVFSYLYLATGEALCRLGAVRMCEPADRDVATFECLAWSAAALSKAIEREVPDHPTIQDDLRRGAGYLNTMVKEATGWRTDEIMAGRFDTYRSGMLEEPTAVYLARILGSIVNERQPAISYAGLNPEQMEPRTLKIGLVTKTFADRSLPNFTKTSVEIAGDVCA